MKIDYGGRTWEFDLEEMTVPQCEAVEKYVGKGLGEWANQMLAGSVKAVTALWWVMRSQAGEDPGPISQPGDDFRPVKLINAFGTAAAEQAAAAAAAGPELDPTRPAGSSPESAATTTTPASTGAGQSPPG
jgi:hypothetical protein